MTVVTNSAVDIARRLRREARRARKLRGIERQRRMRAASLPTLADYAMVPVALAACCVLLPVAALAMVIDARGKR